MGGPWFDTRFRAGTWPSCCPWVGHLAPSCAVARYGQSGGFGLGAPVPPPPGDTYVAFRLGLAPGATLLAYRGLGTLQGPSVCATALRGEHSRARRRPGSPPAALSLVAVSGSGRAATSSRSTPMALSPRHGCEASGDSSPSVPTRSTSLRALPTLTTCSGSVARREWTRSAVKTATRLPSTRRK